MTNLYLYQVPETLNNIKFGLSWVNDVTIRDFLYRRYKLYLLSIPNSALTAEQLQLIADFVRDKYNKLYETTQYTYNPIVNYDNTETVTETRTKKGENDGKSSQFPMDSGSARDVVKNNENSKETENFSHSLRRTGNIGTMTTQTMIQAERDIIINLLEMYTGEFSDYFMINTWGIDYEN